LFLKIKLKFGNSAYIGLYTLNYDIWRCLFFGVDRKLCIARLFLGWSLGYPYC